MDDLIFLHIYIVSLIYTHTKPQNFQIISCYTSLTSKTLLPVHDITRVQQVYFSEDKIIID